MDFIIYHDLKKISIFLCITCLIASYIRLFLKSLTMKVSRYKESILKKLGDEAKIVFFFELLKSMKRVFKNTWTFKKNYQLHSKKI